MWHVTYTNHIILDFKGRLLNILKSVTFSFIIFSNGVLTAFAIFTLYLQD